MRRQLNLTEMVKQILKRLGLPEDDRLNSFEIIEEE